MLRLAPLAFVLVTMSMACESGAESRCSRICDVQARCADQVEGDRPRFDSGECTAACKALERDDEGRKLVDDHVICVDGAGLDCSKIAACD